MYKSKQPWIHDSISATHLHPWKLDKPHDDFLSNSQTVLTHKIYHFPLTCEEKECFMVPLSRIVSQNSLATLRNKKKQNKDEYQSQHVDKLFAKEYEMKLVMHKHGTILLIGPDYLTRIIA